MKYLILLVNLLFFEVIISQEIKIEANIDSFITSHSFNSIRFKISNCTNNDLWFYVHGLSSRMYILDENGNRIDPFLRVGASPTRLPDFILLQANDVQEIVYPIDDLSKRFKFEKNKAYYLYYEYENISKKKKTKIKTFRGIIILNPVKF